ncbi:uncharacterized protein DS421_13g395140 [Arachis hypogaea]|nr:uncharacterized protein DS421_13g395140 [Arachis hypogaea]
MDNSAGKVAPIWACECGGVGTGCGGGGAAEQGESTASCTGNSVGIVSERRYRKTTSLCSVGDVPSASMTSIGRAPEFNDGKFWGRGRQ